MTELKTLKDLEIKKGLMSDVSWNIGYEDGQKDTRATLKQEAIKWVKKMKTTKSYYNASQEPIDAGENMKEDLLRYFKEFFNLTEDDLK